MKVHLMKAQTNEEIIEAERIKQILVYARKQAGLTQAKAAEKIGISKIQYHRYENDFKKCNSYMQERICEALYLPKPKIFEKGL